MGRARVERTSSDFQSGVPTLYTIYPYKIPNIKPHLMTAHIHGRGLLFKFPCLYLSILEFINLFNSRRIIRLSNAKLNHFIFAACVFGGGGENRTHICGFRDRGPSLWTTPQYGALPIQPRTWVNSCSSYFMAETENYDISTLGLTDQCSASELRFHIKQF